MSRALALAALLLAACRSAPPLEIVTDGRYAMGTLLEISVVAPAGTLTRADLAPYFDEVARLEAIFSGYDPKSPVSQLNAHAGRGPLAVPPELYAILAESRELGARSAGAFDVSVGPLVALWTRAARDDRLPGAAALAEARARVGAEKLRLRSDGRVELPLPGMAVDLGGIAKGWALDRVAARMRDEGRRAALLDFGRSSLVAIGAPPDAPGWRILLEGIGEGGFAGTLTLRDRALSVSGSLGQWSAIEGRRYGHIVDPRRGEPMTRTWLAVVASDDATSAEAWSKALLILGPDAGFARLADERGAEGLLLDESGASFATPGFAERAGFAPQRDALAPRGGAPRTALTPGQRGHGLVDFPSRSDPECVSPPGCRLRKRDCASSRLALFAMVPTRIGEWYDAVPQEPALSEPTSRLLLGASALGVRPAVRRRRWH